MAIEGRNGGTLKPWKSGESGNANGRPRRAISKIEKEVGVQFRVSLSKEDKFQILEAMLEMSSNELSAIAKDAECPVFMVTIAKAIKKDHDNGRLNTISELFDRFFGKASQNSNIDVTSNGETIFKGFKFLDDVAKKPEK